MGDGGIASTVTDFVVGDGWWVIPLVLAGFIAWSVWSGVRKARRRRRNEDLAANLLLMDSVAEAERIARERAAGGTAQD